VSVPIAVGFLIIDRVATYLEDPFVHRVSSTPMLTLSRTIEINIRQMLDEQDLPPMMEPVEGVLY
jgi:putative membrane protein